MKRLAKVIMLLALAAVICLPGKAMADFTLSGGTGVYWSQPGSVTFDRFDTYFTDTVTFSGNGTIGYAGSFVSDGWSATLIDPNLSRAIGTATSTLLWDYSFAGTVAYPLTFDINYYNLNEFVGHEGYSIIGNGSWKPPNGWNLTEYARTAVPEPATMLLLGLGLVGVGLLRRKS